MKRKAAAKAAAGGEAEKPAKKPWWQAELDAGAVAKRTSKAEDDAEAYRAEVWPFGIKSLPLVVAIRWFWIILCWIGKNRRHAHQQGEGRRGGLPHRGFIRFLNFTKSIVHLCCPG